ncbi:hypothetical protein GGR51DRAFT_569241 [Nemania sp. FL0031]|nr:hypothetical protein GGR51DRAFT_569241 [Nemania sp. FL0031]
MEALGDAMNNLGLTPKPWCCNNSESIPCGKPGTFACKGCLMLTYCSKSCQKAHWGTHRKDCKSPFMKQTWEPRWMVQNRTPAFVGGPQQGWFGTQQYFGTPKYLWGNVPAIDIVQLRRNEGVDFEGPISMLFAASGDIRNAIFSVASLPPSYRGTLNIVINDRELDIVARNIIFLLIFFAEDDPIVASENVLHMWYSALVPESCYNRLRENIKLFVKEVCNEIAENSGTALLEKTWQFGTGSLRVVLTRDNWLSLLRYFDISQGLTKDKAQQVRQSTVSATERIDYVDRALCKMSPSGRMGMAKFREDGILLPFGQIRETFTRPNPTLFVSPNEWPMMDGADPTAGWSMRALAEFDAGPATNDVYGKLYFYLKDLFASFHRRIRYSPIIFELLHVDARVLPTSLAGRRFDRVDVGNICDMAYLGIDTTLETFGSLLQPPSVNSHATLITLFLNAIADVMLMIDNVPAFIAAPFIGDQGDSMRKVLQYMPELGRRHAHPQHPNFVKAICALSLVYDMEMYFDCYMDGHDFKHSASAVGLQMKSSHTIVDPWPWRISGGRPTPKAREEFALLLSSAQTGQERFVEWKLASEIPVGGVPEYSMPVSFEASALLALAACIGAAGLFRT